MDVTEEKIKALGSYQLAVPVELTERVKNLISLVRNQPWEVFMDRIRIVTKIYKDNPGLPPILLRAKVLEENLRKLPIYILPGELIVGNRCRKPRGDDLWPEFDVEWYLREIFDEKSERLDKLDGEYYHPWERPADTYHFDKNTLPELKEILDWWEEHGTHTQHFYSILPEEARIAHDVIKVVNLQDHLQGGIGHYAPDHEWLLKNGLKKVIEICEKKSKELKGSHKPEDFEKRIFADAVVITCKAAIDFAHRYRDLAKKKAADEKDERRKEELLKIARICDRVPENPAQGFHEALQFVFFTHMIPRKEDNGSGVSLGRFDQFLWPYYKNDVEKGNITREEALELVECFFVKIYEQNRIRSWGSTDFFRGAPQFQNLTIGGIDPDTGRDATNELTYIVLDALAGTRVENPSVTGRWHKKAPMEYKRKVAETARIGIGFPAVFNDSVYIPALLNRGYQQRDAFNYCIIGCVEPGAPGLRGGRTGGCWFNMGKVLEMTLHGGEDPRTGIKLHPNKSGKDLSTYSSYDELWEDFIDQLDYYLGLEAIVENTMDYSLAKYCPLVFSSVVASPTTVLERLKQLQDGGAKYDFTGQQTIGTANVGNSLFAIKSLVFDKKKITGEQLLHALKTNFEDNSTDPAGREIKAMCENEPKYGNDIDEVDFIARDALEYVAKKLPTFENTRYGRGPIGGVLQASTSTVSSHIAFGSITGALPDGRPAGISLADGQSPMRGTDVEGPTAAANSVAKIKNILLSEGSLYNLKFPVQQLMGKNLDKFIGLIDHYFEKAAI